MVITLVDALNALGISAYIHNNDYDTIVWNDPKKTVSKKDLESKVAELQAEYDSKNYARKRADAYPSWQTQMDQLYHLGYDGWKAEIQKVKDEFPKP
tara:strand:- start:7843 stop:8133 length:291 start_codon:yes stop_codon:yes gene_type:complete